MQPDQVITWREKYGSGDLAVFGPVASDLGYAGQIKYLVKQFQLLLLRNVWSHLRDTLVEHEAYGFTERITSD